MTTKNQSFKPIMLLAVFFALTSVMACKPSTPPDPNEEEMITSVVLHFADSSGVEPDRTFMYRDLDGDGGASPSRFDTLLLSANKTYWVNLYFLDETKMPTDTISQEVNAEADEHLICYTPSNIILPIQLLDKDAANLPLGLNTKWQTGVAALGSLRLQLRHQPGNKNGSCEPGSSDIDLTFSVKIQ